MSPAHVWLRYSIWRQGEYLGEHDKAEVAIGNALHLSVMDQESINVIDEQTDQLVASVDSEGNIERFGAGWR